MRTFELLLILLTLADGTSRIVLADRRPIWISTIPMFAFLFGIIHIAGEGARWQMIPIYGVVVVAFSASLIRAFQTGDILISGSRLSRGVGGVVILLAITSLVAGTALPVFTLPAPSGHYAVGVRDVILRDPELTVQVYFPSDQPVGNRSVYGEGNLQAHARFLSSRFGIPLPLLGHLSRVRTHTFPGAGLSRELPRYRVLIEQPEVDRPSTSTTGLAEDLASHGFLVITVPVATDTADTARSTVDAESIADRLESIDPDGPAAWLADRLDLGRIGVYGLGSAGKSVIEACLGGTFRAGAVIGSEPRSTSPVVPFIYLRPEGFEDPPLMEASATTYVASVRGMMADNFGDDAFVSPLMPALGEFGSIDPVRGNDITRVYLGAFFNKHLTRGTVEPILDGPSSDYPEVSIQIHDAEE